MKSYVYLLCDGERFKIGVTKNSIEKRIQKLQTGNPNEIFISNFYMSETPYKLEMMLHNKFFKDKVKNEWFDMTAHDVAHFEEICEHLQQIINSLHENIFFENK